MESVLDQKLAFRDKLAEKVGENKADPSNLPGYSTYRISKVENTTEIQQKYNNSKDGIMAIYLLSKMM